MIKTSTIVPFQLPSFIRDDENYQTFITFLEAYYEWMEQEGGVLYEKNKVLDYIDIDNTLDEFIDYFYTSFLPSFPLDVITDKRKLLKFSKELYENKGNRASYKFLFRALYNTDSDIIETKEFVLKASAGKWFLPKSIKIKSNDSRWINTENLWVFGNTSKTIAKIERAKLSKDKIELFLSDIERLFETGELVKIVSQDIQDLYFDSSGNIVSSDTVDATILQEKLIGSISNIEIDSKYRGNYYLLGDPVVVYGGIDDPAIGIGASAETGEVTLGAIQRVTVENGSWGYRETPNTFIYTSPDSGNPIITVSAINPANTINVNMMVMDSLELKENIPLNCNTLTGFVQVYNPSIQNYYFARTNSASVVANANTRMIDAFSFTEFPTYSIDTVTVQNGGGGFLSRPVITPESVYETDLPFNTGVSYDPRYKPTGNSVTSIKNFGILGPILFRDNRGIGYEANDQIIFTGGIGSGAFANITSVLANGAINTISYYVNSSYPAPLGGFGYSTNELPSVSVETKQKTGNVTSGSIIFTIDSANPLQNVIVGQSVSGNGIPSDTIINEIIEANNSVILSKAATGSYISNTYSIVGTGADLYISTVLGDSARLLPITDRIGAITTIKVTNYGEDYTSNPSVSLKVQDVAVNNIGLLYIPQKGDIVYQGTNVDNSTYKAYVDSVTRVTYEESSETSTYILRVYNYNKIPVYTNELILYKPSLQETQNTFSLSINSDYVFPEKVLPDGTKSTVGKNGILVYGDGSAKATSKFLNGLILGQGRYIDSAHQPSSFSLLQDENYNNFTYIVSVEKEISKYRDILYKLLHPAGTKLLGQTVIKNEKDLSILLDDSNYIDKLLDYEFIWAALATEESDENDYVSELMRFPESIRKYATLQANNSSVLTISTFPDVYNGQRVYGSGIPFGTFIEEVYLGNNSIKITNNCIETKNNVSILAQDFWSDNNELFATQYEIVTGDIISDSDIIKIKTLKSSPLDDLIKNQIVIADSISIKANTINSNNVLVGSESIDAIQIGQYISGTGIPVGTTVIDKDISNNVIIMSQNATANANGISYSYKTPSTGAITSVYKYNYVQFQSIPYNTKILSLIDSNNSIVLSSNCIKSNSDIIYNFMGDGVNRDSEAPSEFIRVESGQFNEKYTPSTPTDSPYFSYIETLLTEDGSEILTENDINITTTVYIKIK